METLIINLVIIAAFFIICVGLYFVGKNVNKYLKGWNKEDKRDVLNLLIPMAIIIAVVAGAIGGMIEKFCFVLEIPVIIFIIVLAGNLACNNE